MGIQIPTLACFLTMFRRLHGLLSIISIVSLDSVRNHNIIDGISIIFSILSIVWDVNLSKILAWQPNTVGSLTLIIITNTYVHS